MLAPRNNIIPQLQSYKQRIPQFIKKLYTILQTPQFQQIFCWHEDDQILIKNIKKLQKNILPKYFRHKKVNSFIRQLNMYEFHKVPKIIKQKDHMYFKNINFSRGQIQKLLLIKRNIKKKQTTNTISSTLQSIQNHNPNISNHLQQIQDYSQQVSIQQRLIMENQQKNINKSSNNICSGLLILSQEDMMKNVQKQKKVDKKSVKNKQINNNANMIFNNNNNPELQQYKKHVKKSAQQIKQLISKFSLQSSIQPQIRRITSICDTLLQKKQSFSSFSQLSSNQSRHDFGLLLNQSQANLPIIGCPDILLSLCSLSNISMNNGGYKGSMRKLK